MIQMIKSSTYLVCFTQTLQRSLLTLVTLVTVIDVHPSYHQNVHSYPSRGMPPSIGRGFLKGIPRRTILRKFPRSRSHFVTTGTPGVMVQSPTYPKLRQRFIINPCQPPLFLAACLRHLTDPARRIPSVAKNLTCGWQANPGVSRCRKNKTR